MPFTFASNDERDQHEDQRFRQSANDSRVQPVPPQPSLHWERLACFNQLLVEYLRQVVAKIGRPHHWSHDHALAPLLVPRGRLIIRFLLGIRRCKVGGQLLPKFIKLLMRKTVYRFNLIGLFSLADFT